MQLYNAMRTTFSAREFTDDPVTDEIIYKILDNARFAPSGGNRQGWKVIIVRKEESKRKIADLAVPGAKKYAAQRIAGENPWNTVNPSSVDNETIEKTPPSPKLRMEHNACRKERGTWQQNYHFTGYKGACTSGIFRYSRSLCDQCDYASWKARKSAYAIITQACISFYYP